MAGWLWTQAESCSPHPAGLPGLCPSLSQSSHLTRALPPHEDDHQTLESGESSMASGAAWGWSGVTWMEGQRNCSGLGRAERKWTSQLGLGSALPGGDRTPQSPPSVPSWSGGRPVPSLPVFLQPAGWRFNVAQRALLFIMFAPVPLTIPHDFIRGKK